MLSSLYWFSIRAVFLFVSILSAFTVGLLAYLLAPLFSYMYFNDWRFWKHHHRFIPGSLHMWHILFRWMTDKEYRSMSAQAFTDPPMSSPDLSKVRVAPSWTTGQQDCAMCGRCCNKIGCPFMDKTTMRCASYNSVFWRYFNCGRYPETQKQITYYDCPKWEMIEGLDHK